MQTKPDTDTLTAEAISDEEQRALTNPEPITDDGMDAVIAVSKKIEEYGKAMDTILNAIVKRSYVGDWVCHARASTKVEDQDANLGSAAAERIAVFLGIRETWPTDKEGNVIYKKVWSDDQKHYTYIYEASFGFKDRWVHGIGRASTRDKFFGYAHGEWKKLEDVNEDDIRVAAFRNARKEGVRALLGLRSIPVLKLKELGYDPAKIAYAGFQEKGTALAESEKKLNTESGLVERDITVKEVKRVEGVNKTTNKPWVRYDVFDTKGVKYALFANDTSRRLAIVQDAYGDATPVKIGFTVKAYAGGENYQIITVNGVGDEK